LLPQGEDFERTFTASAEENTDGGQDGKDEFEHETYVLACVTSSQDVVRGRIASC